MAKATNLRKERQAANPIEKKADGGKKSDALPKTSGGAEREKIDSLHVQNTMTTWLEVETIPDLPSELF